MQCSNFFQKPHAVNKMHSLEPRDRAETKALIEGGGVHIHIFMFCPTNFF